MLVPASTTEPTPSETSEAVQAVVPSDIDYASAPTVLLYLGIGAVAALVLGFLVTAVLRRIGRRSALVADIETRGRRPFRVVLVLVALRVVLESATLQSTWAQPLAYVANLTIIAMVAWMVAVVVVVLEDVTLARYGADRVDTRRARRVQTQASLLRRLTVAAVVVLAVGAMLLTIPGARELGAGVFASAGVVGIVAGLAAQTSIANVFAGLQIAFTDGIRVDDVVVVEGEWGRIEEITLTYVVLHIWDDRRLILPSTYFTTTPFENWTRKDTQVMGDVLLEVDWTVPLDGVRTELDRVLRATDRWDHRVGLMQVQDAAGGTLSLRMIVSACDGPTLADLKAEVREAVVVYLQTQAPTAIPRSRVLSTDEKPVRPDRPAPAAAPDAPRAARAPEPAGPSTQETGLFTGSIAAIARAKDFQGPGEQELAERRRADEARSGDEHAHGLAQEHAQDPDEADEARGWDQDLTQAIDVQHPARR